VSEEEEEVKDAVEEGELSDDSEYDSANNVAEGEELTFDFVDAGPGEEFMAVKPWIGAMKEPSSHSPADVDSSPPDEALELSYAFGYRCRGVFDNVHFSAAGTCGNAGRERVRCALLLRTNLRPRGLVVSCRRVGVPRRCHRRDRQPRRRLPALLPGPRGRHHVPRRGQHRHSRSNGCV